MIATKWWPVFRFASNILKTINQRIRALDPYPIDLYQVHQPWRFSGKRVKWMQWRTVERQQIRAVGVSNFEAHK